MKISRFSAVIGGAPVLALLLILTAGAVCAQTEYEPTATTTYSANQSYPIGLRLGYTSWEDTEQIHFGGHVKAGEVLENVDLTPSFELGLGNDMTVATINGDLTYNFTELMEAPWGFYAGGSLSLTYMDVDAGGSDTDLGLSAVGGFTHVFANDHEGRLEVRLGVMDYPGFKLTFGYTLF